MALKDQEFTVIGAGIAGLAVALALARQGARVTVLEQANAVLEVGAGLQISPNGAAVLQALGLGPVLRKISLRPRAVTLRDGLSDTAVLNMTLDQDKFGFGFHVLHRADLIALLFDAAKSAGVDVMLDQRIKHVDLSGVIPAVILADDTSRPARLLIGADGLHSAVRTALNGIETPFFTHQVAWRAIIANEAGTEPLVEVHMGPGRHLVSYPLRDGRLRNIVAVEERQAWAEESWSRTDDANNLRQAFATFSPKVRGWLDRVEAPGLWGLFRHPVAGVWQKSLPDGGAVILGDAAHPTLPFLAQGANMALEDAWSLAAALVRSSTLADALTAYQTARKPRTSRIVDAATRNARAYHLSGASRGIAHLGLRIGGRLAPDFALNRFAWIYGYDVTTG